MTPSITDPGSHPQLQWLIRGSPAITLTEALHNAIPVEVLDNTVVDAEAYYHVATDTIIVVQFDTVQTILERDGAPLRCPHDNDPASCPSCATQGDTTDCDSLDSTDHHPHDPSPACS
ncbi:hypothetical protein [Halobellus ordinarius]|uniref:hypothetical protein n=1 Tax=Halobellus ordinarius TaxID=3075120 RepID=UPI002880775F|nr:hypothetical protein [Halobellus sp. ZY16]